MTDDATIRLRCSGCQARLKATTGQIGQSFRCPRCGTEVLVWPEQPELPASPTTSPPPPPVSSLPAGVDGRRDPLMAGPMPVAAQIKLPCPYCRESINYEESLGGKTITCGYCKRPLNMPLVAQLPPEYQEEFRHQQDKLRKKAEAAEQKRIRAQQKESERKQAEFLRQQELTKRAEEVRLRQQAEAAQQQSNPKAPISDVDTIPRAIGFV